MKFDLLSFWVLVTFMFASCTASQPDRSSDMELGENEVEKEVEQEVVQQKTPAVVVYPYSIRKEPGRKTEYLAALSKGEQVTFLGEQSPGNFDEEDKKRTYSKVRLTDGTEGWTHADVVIPDSKPAVFLQDGILYQRPDLLTKTDKEFKSGDVIAVVKDGDWLKVVGQPSGESWIRDGWIRTGYLSYDPIDIAAAKFIADALAKEGDQRTEALEELFQNTDLNGSALIVQLKNEWEAGEI
jgi:hypothetical protein